MMLVVWRSGVGGVVEETTENSSISGLESSKNRCHASFSCRIN